ncbi:MAG: hypothetical protein PHP98_04055 [Kiritimatiellae bacterium]|nr:hypothetical protein [Kiritimatiellia bacterium]
MKSEKNSSAFFASWLDFDSDKLFRHSLIVFFFTHAASAANIFFQMVMGWNLSVAEYGVLCSMLGLLMVVATPMTAVSNTLAHFAGNLIRENRIGNVHALTRQWLNRILLVSVPLMALLVILRHPLASFFHLASPWPLLLVGAALFLSVLAPVFGGVLQSMQKFVLLGFPGLASAFTRLLLGAALVLAVTPRAVSGLAAHAAGALCGTALIYFFYRRQMPIAAPTDGSNEKTDRYFWASAAALFSFAVLMNMDVVLVKRYFTDPEDYGNYARASTIARTLVFLVQPIAGAMFPKVVSRGGLNGEQQGTLFRALALAGLIIGGAVFFCTFFPQIPLLILYRDFAPSPEMLSLVRLVCWAMAPLGLVFILMNFELAQHRLACVFPLAACAAVFIGGIVLFHDSLRQVVQVFISVSFLTLIMFVIMFLWKNRLSGKPMRKKDVVTLIILL